MNVLRFVARSMMASYFVLDGLRALTHPEDVVAVAEPVADNLLPKAKAALPNSAQAYLPHDATEFTRLTGAVQVAAGLGLALGIGRRLGAGLLALTLLPKLWAANPLSKVADRSQVQAQFAANVALLGGLLLAAQDTEGRPNLPARMEIRRELQARDNLLRQAKKELASRPEAAS